MTPPAVSTSLPARHPHIVAALVMIVLAGVAGLAMPALQTYPPALQLSTGSFWSNVVGWINVNYFDALEAIQATSVLLNLLVPLKRLLLATCPGRVSSALLALAGYRLGGLRLATLVGALAFLIAATGPVGEGDDHGLSVRRLGRLGLPDRRAAGHSGAAERDRLWRWVQVIIDTLQTLPSFVYLMPVGDAVPRRGLHRDDRGGGLCRSLPAIRYTVHGLRKVDPRLIEAGTAMGCTQWQLLTRIKIKLALPEIMLGLNQTIMFALSMLVITALVGTRDLGQEVYIALTKADTGRGLVAGLAVAFIAIIADRLISAGAARTKARLGLE
jgi:glycine betaine/proline transport system permease protein